METEILSILTFVFSLIGFLPLGLALDSRSKEDFDNMAENSGPPEPYYLDEATIVDAKITSGQDLDHHLTYDTSILLTLDIGRDFQPELHIGGDFKKDWDAYDGEGDPPRVKPLEWGSNFKVDELAARAGLSPLFIQDRDDNVIRDEVIEGLIGQTIIYCRYVYGEEGGSPNYTRYDRVRFPRNYKEAAVKYLKRQKDEQPTRGEVRDKCIEMAQDDLEDNFLGDVEQEFVKDYDPSCVPEETATKGQDPAQPQQEETPAYAGDGAPSGGAWDDDEETFEPDDQLPF